MSGQDLTRLVEAAGVAGAGGAGFPAHLKLKGKVSLVIANGCECEPLLRSDVYLMETRFLEVLAGLELVRRQVKAEAGVVAVKGKNQAACQVLESALERYPDLSLKRIDDFFPAGDEQVLTRLITGKTVPPGGIPSQVGVLVNNVATLFNVCQAQKGIPVTSRIVTVGGAVSSPFVTEVLLGTPFGELIKAAGGPRWLKNFGGSDYSARDTARDYRFVLIVGGPMMGQVVTDLALGVEKTTSGLILLPVGHPLVIKKTVRRGAGYNRIACCGCNECTLVCPRNQLGHPIYPHKITGGFAAGELGGEFEGAFLCSQCGLCEYYACTMGAAPLLINKKIKQTGRKPKDFSGLAFPEVRNFPVYSRRLVQRLKLAEYEGKPPYKKMIAPERVSLALAPRFGTRPLPVVKVGEKVAEGSLVAEIRKGKMGTNLHAPIKGIVVEISPERIVIG